MYNMLISSKIELNKKIQNLDKYKNCEHEYKININILAGKLKINLFKMTFAENENERTKIMNKIEYTIQRYMQKVKKKPKTERKPKKPKKRYPYNNRKNF
ncbi:MAG: hypothetical protein LBU40_05280 [Methanobrevibacter sp.]|jgi:hypothetical protein|nr:hypothetical protein [Methanobrevibacter sp.]